MMLDDVFICPLCKKEFELNDGSLEKGECPFCGFGYYFTHTYTGSEVVFVLHWDDLIDTFKERAKKEIDAFIKRHPIIGRLISIAVRDDLEYIYIQGHGNGWGMGYHKGLSESYLRTSDIAKL